MHCGYAYKRKTRTQYSDSTERLRSCQQADARARHKARCINLPRSSLPRTRHGIALIAQSRLPHTIHCTRAQSLPAYTYGGNIHRCTTIPSERAVARSTLGHPRRLPPSVHPVCFCSCQCTLHTACPRSAHSHALTPTRPSNTNSGARYGCTATRTTGQRRPLSCTSADLEYSRVSCRPAGYTASPGNWWHQP
ncbi:hypothetical protein PLICRDRAFT_433248 [Plicaturopsis crispa FD-325 SS-3]|uniref:Uncharacterized protein n=1 Tax=Plicaturopsis crispa FD-325 SS-3 TaxID=944288 RepID=A0A0C9SKL7_PLICR|nr:hypothetical protein PLICRDRAFT_433248 [Plicaturopsis crispa FD-325 SS-3]